MSPKNPPDDFTTEETELLSNLSEIAGSITKEDRERIAPPPHIWAGIANELFATVGSAEATTSEPGVAEANLIDLTTERSSREQLTTPTQASSHLEGQLDTQSELSRSPLLLVAAAIIGLLVIGGAAIAFIGGDSNPVYAAEISNADLPEPYEGTATATVELDDDPVIVIDFNDPLPTDEPVELWVLNADASDIVSLGLVEPGATTFEWPDGLEPADYPLVDLSIEPADGDETHSGRSILRGELALEA